MYSRLTPLSKTQSMSHHSPCAVSNKDLRLAIARIVQRSGEGHIPSSFSIVDIIDHLYGHVLRVDPKNPRWEGRDYFVLSKGHGCGGLYVVLHKYGFLTDRDLETYGTPEGILGGHPDRTCVPGAEASTGSLGHGFPTAAGIALGLKIQGKPNRVFALLGDGECHEGTVWETANVAANRGLGNLCAIVDWNQSGAQLMPKDDLPGKWRAFGWQVHEVSGHDLEALTAAFAGLDMRLDGTPNVVIAHTVKGFGVSFTQGHGKWHHRIPDATEMREIERELS
jgi:transketolase